MALIASLMAINALAIDIMLPALPQLGRDLQVQDANHVQYVVIAYVLGLGFAQLFFGPISDRFGRRRPLLVSLVGYALFGLACVFATSFELLVLARALQGVAAAGARVISMSIVRDMHSGRQMARVMSLVMMVFMAVPMLAPNLGQVVLWVGPWPWVFVVLVVVGLGLTVWVATRLPETLPEHQRRPLQHRALAAAFVEVITTRVSVGYVLGSGVVFGALFAFVSASEQIYSAYGRRETFTLFFATGAGSLMVGAFLNSRLVVRFGMRRLSHAALLGFIVINVAQRLTLGPGVEQFWLFHIGIMLSFLCFAFIGANFNALALEPLGHLAGTASAFLGFMSTFAAGLLGAALGQRFDGTPLPIIEGFAALGVASLLIVTFTEKGRLLSSN